MQYSDLPTVNALLNTTSAILLTLGYVSIRRGRKEAHRRCMVAAFSTSIAFLVSYLVYHANAGRIVFRDPQWFRPIYLTILLTHTVLAALIVPMALVTLYAAIRRRFDFHRRVARWTWPTWMYVSVTGVLIYFLLYHLYGFV